MKMKSASSASWTPRAMGLMKPALWVVTQTASTSSDSVSVRMVAPTVTVTGRCLARPACITSG